MLDAGRFHLEGKLKYMLRGTENHRVAIVNLGDNS